MIFCCSYMIKVVWRQFAGHKPCHPACTLSCLACRWAPNCTASARPPPPAATDGMRWPALAAHLAARYRQAVAQQRLGIQLPENAAELVQPCDRRLLSAAHMAGELLRWVGIGWPPAVGGRVVCWASWVTSMQAASCAPCWLQCCTCPESTGTHGRPPMSRDGAAAATAAAFAAAPRVGPSLYGAWRLAKLFVADSRQQMELVVLHLPQQQVMALKSLAAGEGAGEAGGGRRLLSDSFKRGLPCTHTRILLFQPTSFHCFNMLLQAATGR